MTTKHGYILALVLVLFSHKFCAGTEIDDLSLWQPSLIEKESAKQGWPDGYPNAIGKKGERGLCQIRRKVWSWATKCMHGRSISYGRAFEPELNKRVGLWLLKWNRRTLRRPDFLGREPSLEQVLAAYNWGIGNLRKVGYRVSKVPSSTKQYIKDIKRIRARRDAKDYQHGTRERYR